MTEERHAWHTFVWSTIVLTSALSSAPGGMMIVRVGQKEREAIFGDAQSLIAEVEQAIGYQPSR